MRTLIVYCSEQNDNVDSLAKQIASKIGADLLRLDSHSSEEAEFHGYYHNCVIFGSPVCDRSIAPPIRDFILKYKDEFLGMNFAAFMWRTKKPWGDCFKELKKLIGPLKAEMLFTENKGGNVDQFCEKLQPYF